MALREEMEATGNWLFRWRSYLPLALLALLLAGLQATPLRDREMHPAWTLSSISCRRRIICTGRLSRCLSSSS